MKAKRCHTCGVVKPLSEFHRHPRMLDGHLNKCKVCKVAYIAEWTKRNPQRRRAIERRYRARHPERTKRMWRVNNAVRRALKQGVLEREPCLFCGEAETQAHHHDYSQPLAVTWLCRHHHLLVHRGGKTA